MLNKAGNRRGNPGQPKSSGLRSKPCAICGLPIVKAFPSELNAVTVHGHCRGLQSTRRLAFQRMDVIEPWLSGLSPSERRAFLEGYRIGSRHALQRFKDRAKRRERAAA